MICVVEEIQKAGLGTNSGHIDRHLSMVDKDLFRKCPLRLKGVNARTAVDAAHFAQPLSVVCANVEDHGPGRTGQLLAYQPALT